MSDNDNNEYMKIDELSGKLKEGLSEEFSTIKGSINDLSKNMNLNTKETEGMTSVSEFVEHLNTCENDECEIHQAQNTANNNNYMKGFLLGAKFGKQKRS